MENVKRLAKALELKRLNLPAQPRVIELRYEPVVDSTGDDAVNITVVVDEATPDVQRIWPAVAPIEQSVRTALQEADVDLWPYFRYRKPSEMGAASR